MAPLIQQSSPPSPKTQTIGVAEYAILFYKKVEELKTCPLLNNTSNVGTKQTN
jgi:hypothetical protein